MKEYTSYEIQDISSAFRNVARRLSRTDHSQCDANLKRFMAILEKEELISSYIARYNIVSYDIPAILKARDWLDPFEISAVQEEEISLCVQLLQHAVNEFDGDFTSLYGTQWYTSTKSTVNDEMRKFIPYRETLYSRQTGRNRMIQEENSGLTIVHPVDRIKEVVELEWARMEKQKAAPKAVNPPALEAVKDEVAV